MRYDFRFDILRNGIVIGEALCTSAVIKFNRDAEVTRAMQLDMSYDHIRMSKGIKSLGSETFTYVFQKFSDRIRPVIIVDGVEQFLGVFMIMATPEELNDTGSMIRLEAYDETMILKQAAFTERKTFLVGTEYLSAVNEMLTECGLVNVIETASDSVLMTDIEFAPGTTYLEAINTLLDGINYAHVHADSRGNIVVQPQPIRNTADHVYSDKKNQRIIPPIKRTTDIYSLPNVITGVVSLPELAPITYTKINDDPASEISVPRRGYRVVQVHRLTNIADSQALKDFIDQKYLESSQVTEEATIETSPEGDHEFGDTVQIDTDLVTGLYTEREWQINVKADGSMTHVLERRVFV